jgi:hypothetical protein
MGTLLYTGDSGDGKVPRDHGGLIPYTKEPKDPGGLGTLGDYGYMLLIPGFLETEDARYASGRARRLAKWDTAGYALDAKDAGEVGDARNTNAAYRCW